MDHSLHRSSLACTSVWLSVGCGSCKIMAVRMEAGGLVYILWRGWTLISGAAGDLW